MLVANQARVLFRPAPVQPPKEVAPAKSAPPEVVQNSSVAERGRAHLLEMANTPTQPQMKLQNVSDAGDGRDGIRNGNGGSSTATVSGASTDRTLKPEDMDRILHEYQVEDDAMRPDGWQLSGWKRDLAELFGVSVPDPIQATETEAKLLDELGPVDLKTFKDNADQATSETRRRYGDANGNDPHPGKAPFNDDHADAFRHAYINALTARDMGPAWATNYWTAHERIPGNDPAREAMDLYNNEVGRRIAAENPGASDEQLADLVEQAVANGEMVVIDKNGNLVPSNSIDPSEAGHPAPDAQPLPGHPQQMQTS